MVRGCFDLSNGRFYALTYELPTAVARRPFCDSKSVGWEDIPGDTAGA